MLLNELNDLKARLANLESKLLAPPPASTTASAPASVAATPVSTASNGPVSSSADPNHAATDPQLPNGVPVPAPEKPAPFAFADFTWLNGNARTKESVLDTKAFTGEFRSDTSYIYDYNHPIDHSLSGTTEGARTGEFQVQDLAVGGDFHWGNMQGRVLTQYGIYSTATPPGMTRAPRSGGGTSATRIVTSARHMAGIT